MITLRLDWAEAGKAKRMKAIATSTDLERIFLEAPWGARRVDDRQMARSLAGTPAKKIDCGQAVFIVCGGMRVKGKREIERKSLVLNGGALSADVIISRMKRRVGARVVSVRSTLEMRISIARCLGVLLLLIAANSTMVFGRQGSAADVENLKRQAHEAIANGELDAAIGGIEKGAA